MSFVSPYQEVVNAVEELVRAIVVQVSLHGPSEEVWNGAVRDVEEAKEVLNVTLRQLAPERDC